MIPQSRDGQTRVIKRINLINIKTTFNYSNRDDVDLIALDKGIAGRSKRVADVMAQIKGIGWKLKGTV